MIHKTNTLRSEHSKEALISLRTSIKGKATKRETEKEPVKKLAFVADPIVIEDKPEFPEGFDLPL